MWLTVAWLSTGKQYWLVYKIMEKGERPCRYAKWESDVTDRKKKSPRNSFVREKYKHSEIT